MFDIVPGIFAFAALVVVIFIAEISGRQRGPRQPTIVVVQAPEESQPRRVDLEAEDSETRHWTAQALRKLGYSRDAAHAMADKVPEGMELEQAITWCLRQRGAKK